MQVKVTTVLNNLQANGFTEAEIAEADEVRTKRAFFRADTIYGGETDKSGYYWKAAKVGHIVTEGATTKHIVRWAPCYGKDQEVLDKDGKKTGEIAFVCYEKLSKTFLLTTGTFDAQNNHIEPKGSIRDWANQNIVSGTLDSQWVAELVEVLNKRGCIMNRVVFQCRKKDGGTFAAEYDHPYFGGD